MWWHVPGLDRLERASLDARFRLRGPREPDRRIVVVGVDDKTRSEDPDVLQTRRGWARLLEALGKYEPKVIALDVFFSAPEVILDDDLAKQVRDAAKGLADEPNPNEAVAKARDVLAAVVEELRGDEVLANAVERAKVIYLGANFRLIERREQLPKTPPREPPGLEKARHGEVVAQDSSKPPPPSFAVNFTMASVAKGAIGAGAVNVIVDDDGEARRAPMVIEYGGHYYMPIGLAVALAELGKPGDTSYALGDPYVIAGGVELPVERDGTARIDFAGQSETFTRISAADVLAGRTKPEELKGKLVFVGTTFAAFDKIATPYDQLYDGVELHATLADNILNGRLFAPPSRWIGGFALVWLCGVVTVLQARRVRKRAFLAPAIAVVLAGGWLVAGQIAFAQHTIVDVAAPALSVVLVAVVALAAGLATEGREKAQLRSVFSQYVSKTLVERVIATPESARLGGERRTLSVLFSDIRGFSRIAEALPPETLVEYLNQYLTPMTQLVLDSSGTLDKYIGDAVMAVWGAPVELADHPNRACGAALAMIEGLVPLNAKWKQQGLPEIAIGVGINTGPMAVGNMGSEARFDYTVLGDAVNLAARLEALTKEYGVEILVGEETAKAATGFVFRELDLVRVKGRGGAAAVYELLGRTGSTKPYDLDKWADALAAYRRREFAMAGLAFHALAQAGDRAAAAMAARSDELVADPPPADWDGVYDQRSK
ncbi:MAG TPA: adenylate/guanylate cyclase domain-containing protein [Kofleriaceae bacterium]|nr:adenylate/guanylate cyclase domain-containing protein [Kofleriaceae bacterium]